GGCDCEEDQQGANQPDKRCRRKFNFPFTGEVNLHNVTDVLGKRPENQPKSMVPERWQLDQTFSRFPSPDPRISANVRTLKTRLKGKATIVTGGNGGIGRAVATALAEAARRLIIAGRRQQANEKEAGELRQHTDVTVIPVTADVSHEEDCRRLI